MEVRPSRNSPASSGLVRSVARTLRKIHENHYQALAIPQEATAEHIKRSHRSLVKRCHPDLFPSGSEAHAEAESRMREINVAYAALSNPRKQASYDETQAQGYFSVIYS